MVRDFDLADREQVLLLAELIFDDFNKEDYLSMMGNKNYGFLVSEVDGKVVGFVCFLTIDEKFEIIKIGVSEKYRKLGVATGLLLQLESLVKSNHKTGIILEVNEHNNPARRLYEKMGYKPIHIRKKYYNYTDDAIIMIKEV